MTHPPRSPLRLYDFKTLRLSRHVEARPAGHASSGSRAIRTNVKRRKARIPMASMGSLCLLIPTSNEDARFRHRCYETLARCARGRR